MSNRRKIGKWNFIKTYTFCTSKDIIKKVKRQPKEGEKYLKIIYLVKAYYPNYIKSLHSSTIKRQIPQFKNGQRICIGIFLTKMHENSIISYQRNVNQNHSGSTTLSSSGCLLFRKTNQNQRTRNQKITSIDKNVEELEP